MGAYRTVFYSSYDLVTSKHKWTENTSCAPDSMQGAGQNCCLRIDAVASSTSSL